MEQEYVEYLKDKNKTDGTIKTYITNLECYKRWLLDTTGKELKKLYRENIQDYISYLRNIKKTKKGLPLKAQSINVHISSLIKLNKFLVDTGKQSEITVTEADILPVQKNGVNPCKVTRQEIQEFRQDILEMECRSLNNFEAKRNFCIVTLLQYCGIRISECISIMLDDLALDTRELIIRRGKGDKQRTLFLNDKCISAIKNYLEVRPETDNVYLFVSRQSKSTNKPIDRTTINKLFNEHSDKMTPHQERHGWATHGLEEHIYDLHEVQYLAGHKSLSSTQIYLNPNILKMKEKANQQ